MHVLFVQHHVEVVEVFGQPPHLHVRALADDDRMIALPHQRRHGAVGRVHERTGRLDDIQTERASRWPAPARRRRARSPSRVCVFTSADSSSDRNPLCLRARPARSGCEPDRRGWSAGPASALLERQRNRVAHAKAHARDAPREQSWSYLHSSKLCYAKCNREQHSMSTSGPAVPADGAGTAVETFRGRTSSARCREQA